MPWSKQAPLSFLSAAQEWEPCLKSVSADRILLGYSGSCVFPLGQGVTPQQQLPTAQRSGIHTHLSNHFGSFPHSYQAPLYACPSFQVLLNLSASVLSGPCQPRWCLDHLKPLACSAGLLDIPVFVQQERPWDLSPPLGLQGTEEHLALALASLPQPGLPPSLRREGSCRRCVVVGNGGVLHGSHLGSHIDQYDIIIRYVCLCQTYGKKLWRRYTTSTKHDQFHRCIFISVHRMNNAPVPGFERDAGSRTTIRLMYPEAAPHSANEYKNTTMVALVVFKSLDLDWLTSVVTKQPLVNLHHRSHCTQKACIT